MWIMSVLSILQLYDFSLKIMWTMSYMIWASKYLGPRVFPLCGSVLVVDKVNSPVWLYPLLPPIWQGTLQHTKLRILVFSFCNQPQDWAENQGLCPTRNFSYLVGSLSLGKQFQNFHNLSIIQLSGRCALFWSSSISACSHHYYERIWKAHHLQHRSRCTATI